jgi:hypothetical protein
MEHAYIYIFRQLAILLQKALKGQIIIKNNKKRQGSKRPAFFAYLTRSDLSAIFHLGEIS